MSLNIVLMLCALVCFVLHTLGFPRTLKPGQRLYNLMSLGFVFWVIAILTVGVTLPSLHVVK